MAKIQDIDLPHLEFAEAAAPGTPASGIVRIYAKTDGNLYQKDDAGTETSLASAGSSLGAWTGYTPTWDAAGATSIGNGTLTGRYKALDSKTYIVQVYLEWGSTTSCTGTGAWNFTLPSVTVVTGRTQVLAAQILDSGTDNKLAVAQISSGGTTIVRVVPEGGNEVSKTVPMTWATGDVLSINGIIEVA